MTTTRDIYISSSDRLNTDEPTGSVCDIDLNRAQITCAANEVLRIAVTQASFPAGSMGLSQATLVRRTSDAPDCAVLHFFYNEFNGPVTQTQQYYVYLNDLSGESTNPAGVSSIPFTQRTTVDQIIVAINDAIGTAIVQKTSGDSGQYRLDLIDTTLYDSFYFYHNSTPAALRALGLYTDRSTGLSLVQKSPYDVCIANALPILYIQSNLNTNTYSSNAGLHDILCSVPVHTTATPQTAYVDSSTSADESSTLLRSMSFNYSPFVNPGNYKRLGDRVIDNLQLRVVDARGYPLLMNTGMYSIVLSVQISGDE